MRKPSRSPRSGGKPAARGRRPGAPRSREEVLYGIQPIAEALQHRLRPLEALLVKSGARNSRIEELVHQAQALQLPVRSVEGRELDQRCPGAVHQGVVLECGERETLEAEALPDARRQPYPVLMALDQVEDPHNLGAILRTCGFFGVDALVMPRDHAPPLGGVVAKSSTGVSEWFPILKVPNLHRFLTQQQQAGYWVVGLDMNGAEPLTALQRDRALILVMGNEGQGLRPLTRQTCDWAVQISGSGAVESLNVSNAAAITLHQVFREA